VPCVRCTSTGPCGCAVVGGPNVTVSGQGTATSPWVISTLIPPSSPSNIIFDGANGSSAPAQLAGAFVLCSPSGGGVNGAPSQAPVDFPSCPPNTLPSIYQTTGGLRAIPTKKTTFTVVNFGGGINLFPTQTPANGTNGNMFNAQDLNNLVPLNVTNTECWPMQYFVQVTNHTVLSSNTVTIGASIFYDVNLVINGALPGIAATHLSITPQPLGATPNGVDRDWDISTRWIPAGVLPPGGAMTLTLNRIVTITPGSIQRGQMLACVGAFFVKGVPF